MVTYNKLILLILMSFISIKSSAQTVDQFLSSRFAAKNLYSLQRAANYQTVKKLIANVGFEATTVSGKKVFANRAITIGKASIANAIKKRAFSPYGLAVTAAITAAGYYFDNSSKTITTVVSGSSDLGRCTVLSGQPHITASECLNSVHYSYGSVTGVAAQTTGYIAFNCQYQSWCGYWYPDTNNVPAVPFGGSQPVTDTDLINAFDSYFTPEQEKEIFLNPVSRLPDVPGQSDVASDLDNDYVAQNDADPATNPTTGNTTINNTDITYSDNGYTDVTNFEQKDPCQLHPNSVGCLDVGQAPQDPSIQTYQMPFSVTQYSLGSNAQCPAPNVITLKNGQIITFSYQTYCDFATGIRPVVVALGFLLAYLIVGGAVREGV